MAKMTEKQKKQKKASKDISKMYKKYEETGKVGTSKPTSKKKALKQIVAIELSKQGLAKKK